MQRLLFSTLCFALISTPLAFGSAVRIGSPLVQGNKCTRENVSFSLATDQSALSILFSGTQLTLPADSASNKDNGNCKITVPLEVAPGKILRLTSWDYRGFLSVDDRSWARMTIKNKYLGEGEVFERLPSYMQRLRVQGGSRDWNGPENSEFTFTQSVATGGMPQGCGQDLLLEIEMNWSLFRGANQDAVFTLDSSDGRLGANYALATEDCQGGDTGEAKPGEIFQCSYIRGRGNRPMPNKCDTGAPIRTLELIQDPSKKCAIGRNKYYSISGNFISVTGECAGVFKVTR